MFNYKLTICVCLQKTFRPLFLSTSTSSLVVATLFAQATSDIGVFVCAEFTPAPDSSMFFWPPDPTLRWKRWFRYTVIRQCIQAYRKNISLEHLLYTTCLVQYVYLTRHDVLFALMFNVTRISTCVLARIQCLLPL